MNQPLVSLKLPVEKEFYSLTKVRNELAKNVLALYLQAHYEWFEFALGPKVTNAQNSREASDFIVKLARLNAFVATTIICLWDDGTDKAGGHTKKLYQDKFPAISSIGI